MCLLHKDLDWGRFIRDEVANREDYFHALETCDDCLQDYTRQLQAELQEPSPHFTDLTMERIAARARAKGEKTLAKLKPFWHYLVAACLTLFLFNIDFFGLLFEIFPLDMPRLQFGGQMLDRLGELWGNITTFLGG
ncbi:MAG TPA: hypothetical protein PKN71_04985 [Bacillota bacterium]|jgi:hypothetical protein|nr:hypothetical protein [Bacillota bacterium]HOC06659.1 hypothetical protein [Bacillota bacterium]HPZ21726.1 hypothetical protein [Bacillota bacterium]HQD19228.1 hypothetical protein [Bacillota bacterium]